MKVALLLCVFLFTFSFGQKLNAQPSLRIDKNDTITLAQAYINLSLTQLYLDELRGERIQKILSYEESELKTIMDKKFIRRNAGLFNFAHALLFLNRTKLLYRERTDVDREGMVEWKNTLDKANEHYENAIRKPGIFRRMDTSWHGLINYNQASKNELSKDIAKMKLLFTPLFNDDIYPEFKRLLYEAKNSNNYNFFELWSYASTYNLSLEFSILNDLNFKLSSIVRPSSRDIIYQLDMRHDLISRYIQLKHIASRRNTKTLNNHDLELLYGYYDRFVDDAKKERDVFIQKELNSEVREALYRELKKKYPYQRLRLLYKIDSLRTGQDKDADGIYDKSITHYFFPNPAPMASADHAVTNYKSGMTTLGDVNGHMGGILKTAGYEGQMHYYYHELNGFALTTSLEKFNTDGSKIESDERWIDGLGSNGKFSYYEIFKSLFFEIASEFRMFAFIVSSKRIDISSVALSAGFAEELLENSYPELPEDLKNRALVPKDLTVLVYHFHQNDIGLVPELELSGNLSAQEHLRMAGLENLMDN